MDACQLELVAFQSHFQADILVVGFQGPISGSAAPFFFGWLRRNNFFFCHSPSTLRKILLVPLFPPRHSVFIHYIFQSSAVRPFVSHQ